MRTLQLTAVTLITSAGLLLAGCADDGQPTADDTSTTAAASPTDQPSESTNRQGNGDDDGDADGDDNNGGGDSGASDDVGDFPDVDGFSLVALPAAYRQAFQSAAAGAPQIAGFEGRLVEKNGKKVGFTVRIGVNADAGDLSSFERDFLPAFAGGLAGTNVQPEFEEIDGVTIVKVRSPDGATAYAWVEDNVATVTTFQDAADAEAYAKGAID